MDASVYLLALSQTLLSLLQKKEELQKVSDAEERAVEIDRFNEEIKELHQVLISREVDLLFGLEVGGARLGRIHRTT